MTTYVPLKRVARIRYGLGQPPPTRETGIPIIRATNIYRGSIVEDDLIYADSGDLPLDRAPLLEEGEILVVRSGAYTGDSARVTEDWAGSAPGYDLRITPRAAESRYIAYALLSSHALDQIRLASSRAAQPHLNAEELGNVEIMTPAPGEQRRIADFLDAETSRIDRLSALHELMLQRVSERDATLLEQELEKLRDRFGSVPLRRFTVGMDQGSSPQCDAVPAADHEWGVLKVSAIRPAAFYPQENKRLPEEATPDPAHEVHEGDLLITRANTPDLVGSTAVVPAVRPRLLLSDKIFRVRLDKRIDPHYVAIVARSRRVRTMSAASSNGASQSMANIRFEEVKGWPIPPIPLEQQRALVKRINRNHRHVEQLRSKIGRQRELLEERRRALITAAVTGEFDVSTASGRGIED